MRENQIHVAFEVWLRERQIPYVHHRTDRKSGIAKGWPDYSVFWMGRAVLIEVKTEKGKLRPEQVKMIEYIRRSGNKVEIARSVSECVEAVQSILCDGKPISVDTGGCNYPLEGCFKELKRTVENPPGDGKQLFIGNWKGHDAVFQKNGAGATFLHLADKHDRETLKRGSQ